MASTNLNMLGKTGNNEKSDECYTPKVALEDIYKYLDKDLIWWEPTSGNSKSILRYLQSKGFITFEREGDFFENIHEVRSEGMGIITNPPYSKKDEFLKACYESGMPFAMLLPVSAFQGQKRGRMFEQYGLEFMVLNNRVDFTGGNKPHFGAAWFCRGVLPEPMMFVENDKNSGKDFYDLLDELGLNHKGAHLKYSLKELRRLSESKK